MCYTLGMKPRIIAFDIGDKRIGVAVSDPFGEFAIPSDTYFRTGRFREDVSAVAEIARRHGADAIVCGLPYHADGSRSDQLGKTERFIGALAEETDLPVYTEDERFTTDEARRDLVAAGVTAKRDKEKKRIDSIAAAYILEGYLAKNKTGDINMNMKEEREELDEENNIVELIDEDGNTLRYEHVGTIEYKGEWYCFFTPELKPADSDDDEDEGEEIAVFHLVGEEDDEHLETIEDDALLDEVFAQFCNEYEDSEDADEAALLDSDGE